MSLLLDALKKAADEKQKAARAGTGAPDDNGHADHGSAEAVRTGQTGGAGEEEALELSLDPLQEVGPAAESPDDPAEKTPARTDAEATTAGPVGAEPGIAEADPGEEDSRRTNAPVGGENDDPPMPPAGGHAAQAASGLPDVAGQEDARGVSDEALALLIRKTNHNVRRGSRLLLAGVMLLILVVIAAAGLFYYLDTQEEIASLERRHRLAMQQMQAKTGGENAPQGSAIIRNLVSDNSLQEKVDFAREEMARKGSPGKGQGGKTEAGQGKAARANTRDNKTGEEKATQARSRQGKTGQASRRENTAKAPAGSVLSIRRSDKADPVALMLERAWQAYDAGDLAAARRDYQGVIEREPDNRDALLGLAVIAQAQQAPDQARQYYHLLLQLDPRDAHAIAGLSSLQDATGDGGHENFLLEQLGKNPESGALNFALANLYAGQQRWQQAQAYYFRAWQSDSGNPDYVYNLAVSLDQMGKAEQALSFYRQSLELAASRQAGFSATAVRQRMAELEQE